MTAATMFTVADADADADDDYFDEREREDR